MNQTIKESGILRLKNAIEALDEKLSKSKVINSESTLTDNATRIDTEILKALKTENTELKKKQAAAKEHVDALINELKAEL